jgi:hypothetical protein
VSLGLELRPERAFLRKRSSVAIRELPGFVRGRHRLPTGHGRGAEEFVWALGEQALVDEVRAVYEGAKRELGLRRRELSRAVAGGGGNVEAPQFHFVIELELDPADPSRAIWQRKIMLLAAPRALPPSFDSLFPVAPDELVVPFASPVVGAAADLDAGFDRVVERLEDFAELHGGGVEEDEDEALARLTTRDGSSIALDLSALELSVQFLGICGCRELLFEAQRRFGELAEPIVSVLEAEARARA